MPHPTRSRRAAGEQGTSAEIRRLWTACPEDDNPSDYDRENLSLYALLLDAEVEGASVDDMARVFFRIDPKSQPWRAERVVRSHLKRAHWMLENGFPFLSW